MKLHNNLLLFLLILVLSCNNDDEAPENPADRLPPATQTGEQTFGCLIDGKPFFPDKIGGGRPTAFYQFVDGTYTLGISASRTGDEPSKSLSIGALDVDGLNEVSYQLKSEVKGNFYGLFLLDGGIVLDSPTTDTLPGKLIITRFDDVDHIISGTFEFTVIGTEGEQIKITDGRFDLNYSN